MDLATVQATWNRQGYCVLPGFCDAAEVKRLRQVSDRIFQQWLDASPDRDRSANSSNMAYLTDPVYFQTDQSELIELLEFIANPKILAILHHLFGEPVLFHNTQYFFNPEQRSWDGSWHRDTQFLAPDPELEKVRIAQSDAVHVRVALLDDDGLEYVPGSEKRWDTPQEYAIRKATDSCTATIATMPDSVRIQLKAGDGLLFHAWGIHRGTYRVEKPRRTFDIIYQLTRPCDYYPPPPLCFERSDLLEQLSPQARAFFTNFIAAYKPYWK